MADSNHTKSHYQVIIVGAGPAGLAAGLYTARNRLSTLMLDKTIPGGQINLTDRIENYPGLRRISGPELIQNMQAQCKDFGAEIKQASEVTRLEKSSDGRIRVEVNRTETYTADVLILSPGSGYRKLHVPGEDKFRSAGAGVSYCGTCDAPFFRDKLVVAIGGGNTAVEEAIFLSRFARKVYLVHRRDEFRADKILLEELHKTIEEKGNIEPVLNTIVTSIEGGEAVEFVITRNVKTGQPGRIDCQGVFIFIGMVPNTGFVKDVVDLDDNGFIKCDPWHLRTSMPGVFVAGDCRVGAAMQLATAVGDGVLVAMSLKNYLKDPNWWSQAVPRQTPAGW